MECLFPCKFWRKFSMRFYLMLRILWVFISPQIPVFFLRLNQTVILIFFLCFTILCFTLVFLLKSYIFPIPPFFYSCDSKGPSQEFLFFRFTLHELSEPRGKALIRWCHVIVRKYIRYLILYRNAGTMSCSCNLVGESSPENNDLGAIIWKKIQIKHELLTK